MRMRLQVTCQDGLEAIEMTIERQVTGHADRTAAHGLQLRGVRTREDQRVGERGYARRITRHEISVDAGSKPLTNTSDVKRDRGNTERRRFEADKSKGFGPGARYRQNRRPSQP